MTRARYGNARTFFKSLPLLVGSIIISYNWILTLSGHQDGLVPLTASCLSLKKFLASFGVALLWVLFGNYSIYGAISAFFTTMLCISTKYRAVDLRYCFLTIAVGSLLVVGLVIPRCWIFIPVFVMAAGCWSLKRKTFFASLIVVACAGMSWPIHYKWKKMVCSFAIPIFLLQFFSTSGLSICKREVLILKTFVLSVSVFTLADQTISILAPQFLTVPPVALLLFVGGMFFVSFKSMKSSVEFAFYFLVYFLTSAMLSFFDWSFPLLLVGSLWTWSIVPKVASEDFCLMIRSLQVLLQIGFLGIGTYGVSGIVTRESFHMDPMLSFVKDYGNFQSPILTLLILLTVLYYVANISGKAYAKLFSQCANLVNATSGIVLLAMMVTVPHSDSWAEIVGGLIRVFFAAAEPLIYALLLSLAESLPTFAENN